MKWSRWNFCVLLFLLSLPLGAATRGQDSQPLVGSVFDRSGVVAGAEIVFEDAGGSRLETTTDPTGRFLLTAAAVGRGRIRVSARGYLPSTGVVELPRAKRLEVELRFVDEVTPAFAEGDPESSVREWLERGNEFLNEGLTVAARIEYTKALKYLEGDSKGSVLSQIARAFFLEERFVEARKTLREALVHKPGDPLLVELLAQLPPVNSEEIPAEVLSSDAVASGSVASSDLSSGPASQLPTRQSWSSPTAASRDLKGRQTVHLEAHHSLKTLETVAARLALPGIENGAALPSYAPSAETFELFVPPSYDRGKPHGLLVWISPTGYGGFSRPELARLLEDRQLLWIGANGAGNPRHGYLRSALAVDAVAALSDLYDLDSNRVFVAGYSGGGRISSMLLFQFPEVFTGGVFWFGANHFAKVEVPYRPGAYWPASFKPPEKKNLALLRKQRRMVFVTGDRDFNRSQMRAIHRLLEPDRFAGAAYFQIPGADHYLGLDPEWFGKALAHIDR